MNLSAEQIQANWDKHLKIVDTFITGDRKNRLKDLEESGEINKYSMIENRVKSLTSKNSIIRLNIIQYCF
jgi:hypothetical protein